jgi:hypothetical protein
MSVFDLIVIYLGIGVLFSLAFVIKGCGRIDADARESGLGFRLVIFPGAVILWPYLLRKWILSRGSV